MDETRSLQTHAPAAAHDGLAMSGDGAGHEQAHAHPPHKSQLILESFQNPPPDVVPTNHAVATVLQKIAKWKDYANYGQPLGHSRVIPMKTPLTLDMQQRHFPASPCASATSPSSSSSVGTVLHKKREAETRVHTIEKFVEEQAALGRTVGLVVDLSNHECLYEEELKRYCPSLSYEHFFFVAKHIPDRFMCQQVNRCITSYLTKHPQDYVAIHCSYGWNRTGYVCAAYLVEELKYNAAHALASFALARPPGIRHEHFLSEFLARYGDGEGGGMTTAAAWMVVLGQGEGEAAQLVAAQTQMEGENRETNNETLGPALGQEMLQALQEASRRMEGEVAVVGVGGEQPLARGRRRSSMKSCCVS